MNDLLKFGALGALVWGVLQLVKPKTASATMPIGIKPPVPIMPKPSVSTAKLGNMGIAAIQARLNALGAKPSLVVDGISGPKTTAAIKAFQAAHGIETDGIAGPITQAAMGIGPAAAPTPEPLVSTQEELSYTPTSLPHLD